MNPVEYLLRRLRRIVGHRGDETASLDGGHTGLSDVPTDRSNEGRRVMTQEELDDLLSSEPASPPSPELNSKLVAAVQAGETDRVRRLLEEGADPEAEQVILQAVGPGHLDIVRLLLGAGAFPNTRDVSGMTVLMVAVLAGHADIVQELVDARADVTMNDGAGCTALMLARESGSPEIAAILMRAGATE